jgi:Holliday junction resolvasome RuvABC endonuclease subunit
LPLPIILGLDSATRTGWALVQGEKLLEHGVVNGADRKRQDLLAVYVCGKARPDLVVIEDNYFGKHVDVVKVLSRIVGAWELCFAVRGVDTELLMASTWQRELLTGLISNGSKSDHRKKACALWVKQTYGVRVSEDEADAIGIATWVARRESYAAKVRRVTGALPRTAV